LVVTINFSTIKEELSATQAALHANPYKEALYEVETTVAKDYYTGRVVTNKRKRRLVK